MVHPWAKVDSSCPNRMQPHHHLTINTPRPHPSTGECFSPPSGGEMLLVVFDVFYFNHNLRRALNGFTLGGPSSGFFVLEDLQVRTNTPIDLARIGNIRIV